MVFAAASFAAPLSAGTTAPFSTTDDDDTEADTDADTEADDEAMVADNTRRMTKNAAVRAAATALVRLTIVAQRVRVCDTTVPVLVFGGSHHHSFFIMQNEWRIFRNVKRKERFNLDLSKQILNLC